MTLYGNTLMRYQDLALKLFVREVMPSIMNVFLLIPIKQLKVDIRETTTAASTYLKKSSRRITSKVFSQTATSVAVGDCGDGYG